MRKIIILYTIPNFITAGSGRVMMNIIERLDKEKFSPAVCVSRNGGRLDEVVRGMGIPLIEAGFTVSAKPYITLLNRARISAKVFKPYKFDMWHSWHYADDYTEPIIARFAGAKGWVYTKKAMGWGSRGWLLRSILATRIVADNNEMPDLFFNRYGLRPKTRVIHHGVELDRFFPYNTDQERFRKENQLPVSSVLIGCVAHLVPVKGHPTLIDAIANLSDIHLLLAGRTSDEGYYGALKNQINSLGLRDRVHFMDMVEDVPEFLAQVDIVILPTWDRWRREGCPVALLEAMACGKACIATNVPGSRDIIEDGISGLLVPPEDPDALASAIRKLVENPDLQQRLGAAARQRVEDHFSIEREVAAHEKLYMEIMKKS